MVLTFMVVSNHSSWIQTLKTTPGVEVALELSIHTFEFNCTPLRCSWVLLVVVAVGCFPHWQE